MGGRKLLIALLLALLPFGSSAMSLVVLMVLVVSLMAHVQFQPFRASRDNALESAFMLLATLLYAADVATHGAAATSVFWALGKVAAVAILVHRGFAQARKRVARWRSSSASILALGGESEHDAALLVDDGVSI